MKLSTTILLIAAIFTASAQKHVYDIMLLGEKIGWAIAERIDKGAGVVEYKLNSSSQAHIFFVDKTSTLTYDVIYKNGKLFSSYCKIVKDDAVEVVNILWDGTKYIVKKGEEQFEMATPIDFSALTMYFEEPVGRNGFFSERLARSVEFIRNGKGVYSCRLDNGVLNIYRYQNGRLYELELSKGVSITMKLVQ